jgi:hypothetical protein
MPVMFVVFLMGYKVDTNFPVFVISYKKYEDSKLNIVSEKIKSMEENIKEMKFVLDA